MQQAQAVFTSYRINKNCCAAPPSLATLATRYRLQDHATFPCERLCELKVTQTDQAVQSPFNGAHFRATFAAPSGFTGTPCTVSVQQIEQLLPKPNCSLQCCQATWHRARSHPSADTWLTPLQSRNKKSTSKPAEYSSSR
ncbi:hypothetical protein WJX74_003563 [Apatococcus lobatus]|uniref:Uncharacterized protein n=1 Tax=Apatococcus lobatus TaxID=904363 RepID=A0AAW1RTB7_9CHLO